jgi:hypothetical protein
MGLDNAMQGAQWGGQEGSIGGPWGAIGGAAGGAIDGYFGGPIFKAQAKAKAPPDFPGLEPLALHPVTTGIDQYLSQVPYTSKLRAALDVVGNADNSAWQKTLAKVDPNAVSNAGQLGTNVNSLLRGEIPADVQAQVLNNAAFKSLMGGFAGSPMATNLSARDFGLTSLDLMGKGAGQLQQEASYDKFLNPGYQTVGSTFVSPENLLQRDDRQSSFNNSIDNQNKMINYEIALASKTGDMSGLMKMFGGGAPTMAVGGGRTGGGGAGGYGALFGDAAQAYRNSGNQPALNDYNSAVDQYGNEYGSDWYYDANGNPVPTGG